MKEFNLKVSITDEDFMIYALNNLPEDYNMIFDQLENCLTATGDDGSTMDMICKRLNHWYENLKIKKRKKIEEKALGMYNKQ